MNATPDPYFANPRLAELYDAFSSHRRDFDFYLPLLLAADRVLDALTAFLSDAGFAIEQQYGDWERQPLTDTSPEIITIATAAGA